MKPMVFANQETGVMHHDLLIELGRVDMTLEEMDGSASSDSQQDGLRQRLSAYRSRLREALDKLPA